MIGSDAKIGSPPGRRIIHDRQPGDPDAMYPVAQRRSEKWRSNAPQCPRRDDHYFGNFSSKFNDDEKLREIHSQMVLPFRQD